MIYDLLYPFNIVETRQADEQTVLAAILLYDREYKWNLVD